MEKGDSLERYLVAEVYQQDDDGGTYGVFDSIDGRRRVVKVRTPQAPPALVEALEREHRIQSELRHPHIARSIRYLVLPDGTAVMVLDHASAGAIASWLTGRPVTQTMRRAVLRGLLEALATAHDAGFIHRDVKPENLLMASGRNGSVVQLCDFGMAKDVAETAWSDANGLSVHYRFIGTPGYMSPEQLEHPARVDLRTDLYSVGCVLHEMLTGRLPIDPDLPDYPRRLISGERASVEELPIWADTLLDHLLAPRREDRPNDAHQVLAFLRDVGEISGPR